FGPTSTSFATRDRPMPGCDDNACSPPQIGARTATVWRSNALRGIGRTGKIRCLGGMNSPWRTIAGEAFLQERVDEQAELRRRPPSFYDMQHPEFDYAHRQTESPGVISNDASRTARNVPRGLKKVTATSVHSATGISAIGYQS
ncbi:MAG: hypothetical protein QGH33_02225, partial [Pirellulaceae bacterium]|nr:hypothetical protein [Pirellulaceae bacterium]